MQERSHHYNRIIIWITAGSIGLDAARKSSSFISCINAHGPQHVVANTSHIGDCRPIGETKLRTGPCNNKLVINVPKRLTEVPTQYKQQFA